MREKRPRINRVTRCLWEISREITHEFRLLFEKIKNEQNLTEKELLKREPLRRHRYAWQGEEKGLEIARKIVDSEWERQRTGKTCCACRGHISSECGGACSSKKEEDKVFCPDCLEQCWRCYEKSESTYCEPCQEYIDSQ